MEAYHFQYTPSPKTRTANKSTSGSSGSLKTGKGLNYTAGDIQNPANKIFICELLRDTYANVPIIPYVSLLLLLGIILVLTIIFLGVILLKNMSEAACVYASSLTHFLS